ETQIIATDNATDSLTKDYNLEITHHGITGQVLIGSSKTPMQYVTATIALRHYFVTVVEATDEAGNKEFGLFVTNVQSGEFVSEKIKGDPTGFTHALQYDEEGNAIGFTIQIQGQEERKFEFRKAESDDLPDFSRPSKTNIDLTPTPVSDSGSLPAGAIKKDSIADVIEDKEPRTNETDTVFSETDTVFGEDVDFEAEVQRPEQVNPEPDLGIAQADLLIGGSIAGVLAALQIRNRTDDENKKPFIKRLFGRLTRIFVLAIILRIGAVTQLLAQDVNVDPNVAVATVNAFMTQEKALIDQIKAIEAKEQSDYGLYLRAKELVKSLKRDLDTLKRRSFAVRKVYLGIEDGDVFIADRPNADGTPGRIIDTKPIEEVDEFIREKLMSQPGAYIAEDGTVWGRAAHSILVGPNFEVEVEFVFKGRDETKKEWIIEVITRDPEWESKNEVLLDSIRKNGIVDNSIEAIAITHDAYLELVAKHKKNPEGRVDYYHDLETGLYYFLTPGRYAKQYRAGNRYPVDANGIPDMRYTLFGPNQRSLDDSRAVEELLALADNGGVMRFFYSGANADQRPLQLIAFDSDANSENAKIIAESKEQLSQELARLDYELDLAKSKRTQVDKDSQADKDLQEEIRLLRQTMEITRTQNWWFNKGDGAQDGLTVIWASPLEVKAALIDPELYLRTYGVIRTAAALKKKKLENDLKKLREEAGAARLSVSSIALMFLVTLLKLPNAINRGNRALENGVAFGLATGARLVPSRVELEPLSADRLNELEASIKDDIVFGIHLVDLNPGESGLSQLTNVLDELDRAVPGFEAIGNIDTVIYVDSEQERAAITPTLKAFYPSIEVQIVQDDIVNDLAIFGEQRDASSVLFELTAVQIKKQIQASLVNALAVHIESKSDLLETQITAALDLIDSPEAQLSFIMSLLGDFGPTTNAVLSYLASQSDLSPQVKRAFISPEGRLTSSNTLTAILDYSSFSTLQDLNPTMSALEIQQKMLGEQSKTKTQIYWLFDDKDQMAKVINDNKLIGEALDKKKAKDEDFLTPELEINANNSLFSKSRDTQGIIDDFEKGKPSVELIAENTVVIQIKSETSPIIEQSVTSKAHVLQIETNAKAGNSVGLFLLRAFDLAARGDGALTSSILGLTQILDEQTGRIIGYLLLAAPIDWRAALKSAQKSARLVAKSA
ncbi:MAG: hypothetical protein ACI9CF_001963, partial [Candidatus Omnitrophota bacterium]